MDIRELFTNIGHENLAQTSWTSKKKVNTMGKTAENVNENENCVEDYDENRKIKKGKYISRPAVHTLLLRRGRAASKMRSLREWMSTLWDTS